MGSFSVTMSKFFHLHLIVLLIFISPQLMSRQTISLNQEVSSQNLTFCFVGDTGNVTQVQQDVSDALFKSDCSSIWHTGDIIYPSGINSADDPEFEKKFLIPFGKVLDKNINFYFSLGNHDHKKNPSAYLKIGSSNLLIHFPDFFYKKKFGDICFFVLDTTIFDKLYMFRQRAKQISWLKKTKLSSQHECKFSLAVGHHPLFSSGDRKKASPQLSAFLKNYVFGSFDIYVAGHNHVLADEGELSGTSQLISGTGSLPGGSPEEQLQNKFNREIPGFIKLKFHLVEDKVVAKYDFISANTGESIWSHSKTGKGLRIN